MRTSIKPPTRRSSGYALIMVMILLAVSLTVFASMMYWVSSNAKVTLRNNAVNQAEAAAESATETVLASMIRDYAFGGLNPASTYTNQPDQTTWPITYQLSNITLAIDRTHETNLVALSSQFAGLSGFVDFVTNTITATAINGPVAVPATVQQTLEFAAIPVFQYAIFYNMDLEICPGAAMTIGGHVHSNNNIYYTGNSAAQPLTFASLVDSSGFSTNSRSPNDPQSFTKGNVIFNLAGQPVQNADSLSMPVGTNNNPSAVVGIIQLPPANVAAPTAAAYSPTGSVYLYNAADIIITNDVGGTNFTVLYDNPNVTPHLTPVLPDQMVVTNYKPSGVIVYVTNYIYSFVTNVSFYDYREANTVKAIQIDVGKLNTWLTNNVTIAGTNRGGYQYNQYNTTGSTAKGHNINSIYVYNSVPPSSSILPAVRLVNAAQLPSATLLGNSLLSGLTVATAQPIYTLGNYNVTNNGAQALNLGSTTNGGAVPAALIGDSITVLSSAWSDSYSLSHTGDTTPNGRPAVDTTVNAAMMQGIVPSITVSGNKDYSGGVENYLRMLEDWQPSSGQKKLNYNGSIVCMYPSQYATSYWIGPGTYYNPPTRNWGFDLNFLKGQSYMPPLTPTAKYVIRASYSAW